MYFPETVSFLATPSKKVWRTWRIEMTLDGWRCLIHLLLCVGELADLKSGNGRNKCKTSLNGNFMEFHGH
jgi:hypothetical protein